MIFILGLMLYMWYCYTKKDIGSDLLRFSLTVPGLVSTGTILSFLGNIRDTEGWWEAIRVIVGLGGTVVYYAWMLSFVRFLYKLPKK